MAQSPHDNSLIWNCKSWDELKRLAGTEQAGDLALMIRKFGRTAVLSAGSTEDVWVTGGTRIIPSAGEQLNVVSSSANDDIAGTGAQLIQINGLDEDYNVVTEFIQMDGTTPVLSTNTYFEVYRVRVVLSGSGQGNDGVITLTGATSAGTAATLLAGESITQQSHFTVPAGYTAFTTHTVMSVYRSSGSGARAAEVDQMAFSEAANTQYQTLKYGLRSDGGIFVTTPEVPNPTPEKTRLWYQATAESNNTLVSTVQEILLLKGDFNIRSDI